MRITHRVDYGVRLLTSLARHEAEEPGRAVTRDVLASENELPPGFMDDVLRLLRTDALVRSSRGTAGGWRLARPASEITVADAIRALEGPLCSVRGVRPHELATIGIEEPFVSLWVALRSAVRQVLEHVTIEDLAAGRLPPDVVPFIEVPGAWTAP